MAFDYIRVPICAVLLGNGKAINTKTYPLTLKAINKKKNNKKETTHIKFNMIWSL